MRAASLRAKFLWGMVLVLVLTMTAVTVVVEHRQRATIVSEVEQRGAVLARNLAAISYGPLLLYNFTALEQNVARVAAETDVVYAVVLDADGRIAAHSRRAERVGEIFTASRNPSLSDFAVPVMVGREQWGTVHVGLSRRRMDAEIFKTRVELGVLTLAILLFGGGVAALVGRRIARPVRELAEGAAAISRGELIQRIEPSTSDEIGRLAAAFNHMAVQLFQQRTALEEAHTELRRQFEELIDLKTYADSILASMPSGIVTVDLDGRVVTLNPVAELLTGYFAGEVAGRYCTEVFAHTPEISDLLMETLASRAPIANVPLSLRRRNGSAVPVEFSTTPLKGGEGKDLGVIAVLRDLTLVRRLESDLRRSDRLAALGSLAAGLAHEIKNPLTSLVTFSRHLERRFDDVQFRRRFQSVVPRELERINVIVERLLELARPAPLRFALVRPPDLVERAVELYANQIEAKQIEVRRQYARDVPPIQADPEALYRVFVNLVANAIDAMTSGGRLTLRASWADGRDALLLPRRRSADRGVRVEIEDTGCGIASSAGEQIFHPFYTTRESGTGLGLAIAHKIVQDHGGAISFQSTENRGTTFTVLLPLVPDPPAGVEPEVPEP
ncbi:MAG: PAS domain S-box protein [Candidatus Rokubacteria bacterium]|nr:PAS domain S-box protein [Candidatus Rokubacteria bacterium]